MNQLDDLLSLWEQRRDSGTPVTPEELCADDPGLLTELRWHIHALQEVESRFGVSSIDSEPVAESLRIPVDDVRVNHRYRVERIHASGGLGHVCVAWDPVLNRRVAIKFPRQSRLSVQSRARFQREAMITSRLDHPGIVPVHAISSDDEELPCYVMRFVEGRTLLQAVKDSLSARSGSPLAADRSTRPHDVTDPGSGAHTPPVAETLHAAPLELRELLQRFTAVCNIVAYAHDRGVIHRDIKPANILLGDFGETLLLDWGLARVMNTISRSEAPASERTAPEALPRAHSEPAARHTEPPSPDLTQTGQFLGTPAFASPEQLRGEVDRIDERSDIYSLGATLFTMLTGEPLVQQSDLARHLDELASGSVTSLSQRLAQVPTPLKAVCLKALAVAPGDRYPSALEFAHDVQRFLDDKPVSIPCESVLVRSGRWLRRHPRITSAALAAAFATTAAVFVVTLVLNHKNSQLDDVNDDLADSNLSLRRAASEAQTNERRVMTALRSLSDSVLTTFLDQHPTVTAQQRDYLQRVLAQYEEFANDPPSHSDRNRIRAEGLLHCGGIHLALREYVTAEAELAEALTVFLDESRDPNGVAAGYAVTALIRLGDCALGQNNMPLAEERFSAAITEALRQEPHCNEEHASRLRLLRASALVRRMRLHVDQRHRDQAQEDATDVREVISSWPVDQLPPEAGALLATTCQQLHELHQMTRDLTTAAAFSREAEQLWTSLIADDPDNPEFLNGLASSLALIAESEASSGAFQQAAETCSRGIPIATRNATAHPMSVPYRQTLCRLCLMRGTTRRQLNQSPGAVADLKRAMELGQSITRDLSGSPRAAFELLHIRMRLLSTFELLNDLKGMDTFGQRLITDLRKLPADFPWPLEADETLATSLLLHGSIARDLGRDKEAEKELREVIEITERIVATNNSSHLRGGLMKDGWEALATVQQKTGDLEGALASLHNAASAADQNWPEGPQSFREYKLLADLDADFAALHRLRREFPSAAERLRSEIARRSKVLELAPQLRQEIVYLAGAHCNLGNRLVQLQQVDEALEHCDTAVILLTDVLKESPSEAMAIRFLRSTRISRSDALRRSARFDDCLAELDRIRAAAPREFPSLLRIRRAHALAHLRPEEALAEARSILPDSTAVSFDPVALAEVFAVLSARLNSEADRESAAVESMKWLSGAVDEKRFQDADTRELYWASPDFAPLRSRDDFRAIEARIPPLDAV